MGTANSSSTWPRKWPTARPAFGLLRLSLLCLMRLEGKGRATPLRGLFSFWPAGFQQGSFWVSQVPPLIALPDLLSKLFPFDRAGGFGADIVYYSRHSGHFVYDPGRDTFRSEER